MGVLDDALVARLGTVDMHVASVGVALPISRPHGAGGVLVATSFSAGEEQEQHSNSSAGQIETPRHTD